MQTISNNHQPKKLVPLPGLFTHQLFPRFDILLILGMLGSPVMLSRHQVDEENSHAWAMSDSKVSFC